MNLPTERLTEKMKESLRLVGQGFEAKEIALRLDVTPDAVRERLRAARRILGVQTSKDAARWLLTDEATDVGGTYTRRVDTPPELAAPPEDLVSPNATEANGSPVLREEQASFDVPFSPQAGGMVLPPSTTKGIFGRELSTRDRLLLFLLLTVLLVIGVVGAGSILMLLTQIYRGS